MSPEDFSVELDSRFPGKLIHIESNKQIIYVTWHPHKFINLFYVAWLVELCMLYHFQWYGTLLA